MKNILITGANRGIGLGFVRRYLAENHTVIAACRRPQEAKELADLAQADSGRAVVVELDMSTTESFPIFARELAERVSQIDLLINNAGIYPENRFNSVSAAQIQEAFLVNATAPVLLTRALVDLLKEARQPLVVNISSVLGSVVTGAGTGRWADYAYGPSKAALNRMTRQLALDLRPLGIAVVAQNPGWVRTRMGGQDAPLSVEAAVATLTSLFDKLTLKDSGRILDPEGTDGPW